MRQEYSKSVVQKGLKHLQISRAAIFHSKLEKIGGIKTFAQYLKQALVELGVETIQVSYKDTKHWLGLKRLLSGKSLYGVLLNRVLAYVSLNRLVTMLELNDVLTFNVHGERLFLPTKVVYVHDPQLLTSKAQGLSVGLVKRAYLIPYDAIWSNRLRLYKKSLMVVNSGYSAKMLKNFTGLSGQVLYPPVDVHKYHEAFTGPHDKLWVVTISRFNRFNNLEDVFEIAKRINVAKFFIIGGVNSKDDLRYYNYLQQLIHKHALNNIVLLPNASEQMKISVLSRSKVYFHTKVGEQFGMSVVEAMASSLIPVVHKNGGPWEDVLAQKQGLYGYAYENLDEATSLIIYALNRYQDVIKNLKIVERARDFDYEKFKTKLLENTIRITAYRKC